MLRANTGEMTRFHAPKRSTKAVCIAYTRTLQYHGHIVQDTGVEGIIGWLEATIPLLTACIPDAILVATASWPGNLIRGTKRRQQEVQPCPGLR